MPLESSIVKLRKVAFFLFLIPTLALFLSLLAHNFLSISKYEYEKKIKVALDEIPGEVLEINCNAENNFCASDANGFKDKAKTNKLGICNKYITESYTYFLNDRENKFRGTWYDPDVIKKVNNKDKFRNTDFTTYYIVTNEINPLCIKNYNLTYKIYKIFPVLFELKGQLQERTNYKLAAGVPINPFFYGETSISNLVKRVPINFIFKPLIYISVLLMLVYWIYYNKIFKSFNKSSNIFFIFGVLSAIFLFIHTYFLGTSITNEAFTKLRRLIVILFILFELLAQIFLTKKILKYKNNLINYCNVNVIYLKLIFVSTIIISTIIIVGLLIFYNFSGKIDYILEWNYFLFLLVFYFLSFLLWKKNLFI